MYCLSGFAQVFYTTTTTLINYVFNFHLDSMPSTRRRLCSSLKHSFDDIFAKRQPTLDPKRSRSGSRSCIRRSLLMMRLR